MTQKACWARHFEKLFMETFFNNKLYLGNVKILFVMLYKKQVLKQLKTENQTCPLFSYEKRLNHFWRKKKSFAAAKQAQCVRKKSKAKIKN